MHLLLCQSNWYLNGMLKRKLRAIREAEGVSSIPPARRLNKISQVYEESVECPFQT